MDQVHREVHREVHVLYMSAFQGDQFSSLFMIFFRQVVASMANTLHFFTCCTSFSSQTHCFVAYRSVLSVNGGNMS